jgi:hypothetical protein
MNWRNVLYLLRVERKSGRLIRGVKATHYREYGILAYWPYWVAAIIGILIGLGANFLVSAVYSDPSSFPGGLPPLSDAALGFFVSMPTLILILSLVFTMFQQIQISGAKQTSQVMYWLPITWQEHTLASILSNLLGLPLALVVGFASGIIVFAAFNGLIVAALLTTLALFAAAFIGSSTTEIARVVQVRFIGAVYKSSGRAAVWVRLIGSLAFFLILYLVWFSLFTGDGSITFIQTLASIQTSLWFIPFVWPGIALYYLFSAEFLLGAVFVAASALFIAGLYYLAIVLNQRFGLYEPPAIKVQTSGIYAPKAGLLGKLGFSTVEAALIRKDIRSFTRRRELMSIFIVPIVFIIVPIFNSINTAGSGAPGEVNLVFEAMIFLFPAAIMAMTLGNMLIGEEGQAVWRIYASPISAKNLVKAKFAFLFLLSIIVLIITGVVGVVFFQPSPTMIVMAFLESVFLIFALGSIGLMFGFRGADFSGGRRARMIRQEWSLISFIACALAGLAILAPLVPYVISRFATPFLPFALPAMGPIELAISITISGVIAAILTAIFYKINLNSAKELIRKAEI